MKKYFFILPLLLLLFACGKEEAKVGDTVAIHY